jgi:NADP-dependent aldehyde dehydrogenase
MLHAGIRNHFQSSAAKLAKVAGVTQKITARETPANNCQQSALFFLTTADNLANHPEIAEEVFGPSTVAVTTNSRDQLLTAARNLQGHLTATIHGTPDDLKDHADLIDLLQTKVGRLIFNGWPTGVEVTHAMVHGGPYPATTDPRTTSVGTAAIYRWARPVCYQNFPQSALPEELKDGNPRQIWRRVEGKMTRD